MDPLELVRSRNRADIELPSGLGATIGLVRLQDVILTGGIPLPVLREMDTLKEQNGDAAAPSPEVMARGVEMRVEMVRRTLRRIAPSLAELEGPDLDMPREVIDELSQADFDALSDYAMREVSFPVAAPSI